MRRLLGAIDRIPPTSGAVVMATGVVSSALLADGAVTLSRVLLVVAAAVWVTLVAVVLAQLTGDRRRFAGEAGSPAALTGVAGTAVLAVRLVELGWTWAGAALLVVSFLAWGVLMPIVLRGIRGERTGVAFMVIVATEGLAVLSAMLASAERARWLLDLAVVVALAGGVLYPIVLIRFDLRELSAGRGDHWVAGGALAISALAAAEIARAAAALGTTGSLRSVLEGVALGVWAVAVVWLAPLLIGEVRNPRLGYDIRRFATVFPLGMYAACSFAVGSVAGVGWITDFARGWVWVATAAWVAVFAGMVTRLATRTRRAARSPRPAGSTTPRRSCRRSLP